MDATSKQELRSAYARIAHVVIDEEVRRSTGSSYDEVANRLGFSGLVHDPYRGPMMENYKRIVDVVKRWFGRLSKSFLLVFDGADNQATVNIDHLIPRHARGDIIITTRNANARIFGQPFLIEELPEEAAIDLLYHASQSQPNTQKTREEARRIVKELGRLPLAIDQAGGYLGSTVPDIKLPTNL